MTQTSKTPCPILHQVADLLRQGSEHQRWKQYEQAEAFYTEAVNIAREQLGPDHQVLGYALSDLAQLQEDQGKVILARDNFVAALDILEKHLGNSHQDTLHIFGRLHHLFR